MTIHTDQGLRHGRRGYWVVRGEGGECYVVDDGFFQRTFVRDSRHTGSLEEQGRHYGCYSIFAH